MQSQEIKIIDALEKLSLQLKKQLAEIAQRHNLSPAQAQIIILISGGVSKLSGLAENLGVSSASVSDSVKSLKNKGLIEKAENTRDARSKILSLTDSGRKLVPVLKNYSAEFAQKLNKLHMSEKATLLEGLEKL